MKPPLILVLVAQFFVGAVLDAKDFALIEKLPQRLVQVKAECRKGWASGVTATMKNASYQYNDALAAMIKDLLKTYYPKDFLTDESIQDYLKALYTIHHFRQDVGNPSGESQGTMAPLEVVGEVSGELEGTVGDMVRAIAAEDPKYNFKGWTKKWQQAQK